MNKVMLIGRITKDIELRHTQSGKATVNITLAINRRKKEDGTQEADFISCQAWAQRAEIISKYVKKGDKLGVFGRIETGSYEKDGKKVYTTTVVVDELEFLEKAKNDNPTLETKEAGYNDNLPAETPVLIEYTDADLPF